MTNRIQLLCCHDYLVTALKRLSAYVFCIRCFCFSGPVLALGLARNDAISEWRKLLGPTKVSEAKEQDPQSLRAQFSVGEFLSVW